MIPANPKIRLSCMGAALAWLLCVPREALAQSDDTALQSLVARQAALISELQARVTALEARTSPSPPAIPSPAATAPPANGSAERVGQNIAVDWSAGGPTFRLPNGSSFHVRGRLHVDASSTSGSRFNDRNLSGTQINSARLGVDGTYGDHWGYKVEVDFAGGATSLKETYLSYTGRLLGKELQVYVGNKTGDRSIDGASYDDFVPFFQRSMLATSIGPEKGIMGVGLLAKLAGKDWHVGLDVVGNNPNGNAGTASDSLSYIGRATWTPQIADATRIHFGAWGYYENIANGSIAALTRSVYPGQQFNDNLKITMTPIIAPRSSTGEGGELGLMRGPVWAFGEYGRRHIVAAAETRVWTSYVAEAGIFLTGERPNFSPSEGSWTLVRPRHSVFDGGRGAIELMARYERSDLGRASVAGSGNDLTIGANWYLSSNVRILADWVHWKITDPIAPYVGSDGGDTFNLRFDTTF